jgi:hypothetical protein
MKPDDKDQPITVDTRFGYANAIREAFRRAEPEMKRLQEEGKRISREYDKEFRK